MNQRIYWNTIENLHMKQWIDANMPANANIVDKVNAAQKACLGQDRQRTIASHSIAHRAMVRMQEASTSGVPAAAQVMPIVHTAPATTSMTISPDTFAKVLLAMASVGITIG